MGKYRAADATRELERGRKKIGRPTQAPIRGERVQIGVQVSPKVKWLLEAAAEKNHRSLSREAEFRIERSFVREEMLVLMRKIIAEELEASGLSQYARTRSTP